jgi:hypothetical protein
LFCWRFTWQPPPVGDAKDAINPKRIDQLQKPLMSRSGLPSSTDTGNESTETSGAGPPPRLADPKFKTPESALRHATAQRTEAARQAAAQEYMDAYSGILEAWQSLQPHLSDPRCRQQSAELLAEMEIYGEQLTANSQPLIGKPLKIK